MLNKQLPYEREKLLQKQKKEFQKEAAYPLWLLLGMSAVVIGLFVFCLWWSKNN